MTPGVSKFMKKDVQKSKFFDTERLGLAARTTVNLPCNIKRYEGSLQLNVVYILEKSYLQGHENTIRNKTLSIHTLC